MMWTFTAPILEFATGSIGNRRMAFVIAKCACRKWARENAACALVLFGTMAAVLLLDSGSARAESTTGSVEHTRSAAGSSSDSSSDKTILETLIAWLASPACEVTSTNACTDAVVPGEGSNPAPIDFGASN